MQYFLVAHNFLVIELPQYGNMSLKKTSSSTTGIIFQSIRLSLSIPKSIFVFNFYRIRKRTQSALNNLKHVAVPILCKFYVGSVPICLLWILSSQFSICETDLLSVLFWTQTEKHSEELLLPTNLHSIKQFYWIRQPFSTIQRFTKLSQSCSLRFRMEPR